MELYLFKTTMDGNIQYNAYCTGLNPVTLADYLFFEQTQSFTFTPSPMLRQDFVTELFSESIQFQAPINTEPFTSTYFTNHKYSGTVTEVGIYNYVDGDLTRLYTGVVTGVDYNFDTKQFKITGGSLLSLKQSSFPDAPFSKYCPHTFGDLKCKKPIPSPAVNKYFTLYPIDTNVYLQNPSVSDYLKLTFVDETKIPVEFLMFPSDYTLVGSSGYQKKYNVTTAMKQNYFKMTQSSADPTVIIFKKYPQFLFVADGTFSDWPYNETVVGVYITNHYVSPNDLCNKTIDNCTLWNNVKHYGGFPYVPEKSPLSAGAV